MENVDPSITSSADMGASTSGLASHPVDRPLPLRKYSESGAGSKLSHSPSDGHRRRKSTRTPSNLNHLPSRQDTQNHPQHVKSAIGYHVQLKSDETERSDSLTGSVTAQQISCNPTPPVTPMSQINIAQDDNQFDVLSYDFSKIDYEINRAKKLGEGLWSRVYVAQIKYLSPGLKTSKGHTPPATPDASSSEHACSVFAVKVAKSARAKKVFHQEAKILTKLQQFDGAHQYVVPFYGLDERETVPRLLFEGIEAANRRDPSLEGAVNGLSTMTEAERLPEMRQVFIKVASDLIDGLRFIHAAGIVHADIKAANVLLNMQGLEDSTGRQFLRARYIDFSASFIWNEAASNAGGTWDLMAPEQISSDKTHSKPTFASDIWSLAITLLFIILGESPYAARCGTDSSKVMWRVKNGTPLQDAQIDPISLARTKACQDLVDCCNKALQKNRHNRLSAAAWLEWFDKVFPNI